MVISQNNVNFIFRDYVSGDVATPLLEECEDDIHTLEMGTWESFGTFETLEFNFRGQNISS